MFRRVSWSIRAGMSAIDDVVFQRMRWSWDWRVLLER